MQDNEDPDYDPLDDLAEAVDSTHSGSEYVHAGSVSRYDRSSGPPMTNGMAIASMVMGILSIPSCFCYGIPSIIFAVLGLIFASVATKQMSRGGYASSSRGMNTAGKICSYVGLTLGILYILFFVIMIIIAVNSPPPPGGSSYPY